MEQINISQNLLNEILEYIETVEYRIEGEWGACRTIKKLIEDNDMPDIWYSLKKLQK